MTKRIVMCAAILAAVMMVVAVPAFAGQATFGVNAPKTKVGDVSYVWSTGMRYAAYMDYDGTPSIYAVYMGDDGTIKFSEGWENGDDWGPTKDVSTINTSGATIAITPVNGTYDKGIIHVAFDGNLDTNIYYTDSENFGGIWNTPDAVNGSHAADYDASVAAFTDGTAHVAWKKTSSGGIYVSTSADRSNWTQNLVPQSTAGADPFLAAYASDHLYVAFTNSTSSIAFSNSADSGANWTDPIVVSGSYSGRRPSIAVETPDDIFITFADSSGVKCAYTSDGGLTWDQSVLSSSSSWRTSVATFTSNNKVFVNATWEDSNGAYFSRSENGGASWSTPMLVYDWSRDASITVNTVDKKAHIVFMEEWGYGNILNHTREE
jgi:hypothetical protein